MKYRKFGNTDLLVSEIGFGAWAIGGNAMVGNTPIGWGKADDKTSLKAIDTAMDQGINFFDTADFYGFGHSEYLLGNALSQKPGAIIATKVGHKKVGDEIQLDYTKEHIIKACELSLKRLNREYVDYYQLHSARLLHFKEGDCIEAMEKLRQQGKIRYWGVSLNTFNPEPEADFLLEHNYGDGLQVVYNLINQRASDILDKAKAKSYGIIARMPLQFGLLTGKIGPKYIFPPDDHRSFRFTNEIIEQSLFVLEKDIWPLCEKYSINKTALALSFILGNDAVTTIIPGIRTSKHAIANTQGIVKLDDVAIKHIQQVYSDKLMQLVQLMEAQG